MKELHDLERKEAIILDSQRIKGFMKEIKETDEKNLDECYCKFIDQIMNDKNVSIESLELVRKYNEFLKRNI